MSGIIGHVMYAILGAKAAAERELPIASIAGRHWASYLAGSYLACDIQTMPEAICTETGQEVGFGTVPIAKSPITGGTVRPWTLSFEGKDYRPTQIHEQFYGRSHLVFGWTRIEQEHAVPWDHLPDYFAALVADTIELYGPGERPLAYVFGWMAHVVGDSLIKSIRDGLSLHLLDGKYTPKNRPIQDLYTFHEIGRKVLGLQWESLLSDLAETPIEPVQLHGMRVALPRGKLARDFPYGWVPEKKALLQAVLQENRRYLKIYMVSLLKELELHQKGDHLECSSSMQEASGGLSYVQMIELAEKASFRNALWQMGEAVADLFQAVTERVEALRKLPRNPSLTWTELTQNWKNPPAKELP